MIVTPFLVAAPDRLVMLGEVEPCCGTGGSVPLAYRPRQRAGDGGWPRGGLLRGAGADRAHPGGLAQIPRRDVGALTARTNDGR
jgi:hypothetical protein